MKISPKPSKPVLIIIREEENSRFDPGVINILFQVLGEDEPAPLENEKGGERNLRIILGLAQLYMTMGDYELARSALEKIFESFEKVSDPSIVIQALLLKSRIELGQSQADKALDSAV